MKKWYLVIDVAKCENCNNCFLACKDEHVDNDWQGYAAPQPDHGHQWMNIKSKERGQYPLIDVAYMPVPCMHCDDAPCIRAEANGAIYKRPDGIVIIDPVKAKGQKNVLLACPYGAIYWNEQLDIPQKCTLCAHLLDKGWKQTRCVQSCPTGALSLLHVDDAGMLKIARAENLEVYQPERQTGPHVYYKNLYRFTRCFIGGSVAVKIDGKEECAEGAEVSLYDARGGKVGECLADNYGDFKFDDLAENSGQYRLRIVFQDHEPKELTVDLTTSQNAGVIYV